MCRHAAGEGFLKAFVRHSGVNGFHGLGFEQSHFDDFQSRIGALDDQNRPCHWVGLGDMAGAGPSTGRWTALTSGPQSGRNTGTCCSMT